ncbi:MAG: hypothetical protein WD801_03965 [Gemmatimonadaceae bacterium]
MYAELLVLRLIHILGGVFWVGSAMFMMFFLGPALAKAGPSGGAVMSGLAARKLFTWLPVSALLTMLSGARLMMIASGGDAHWFVHRVGHFYSVSAAFAVIAFLIGMVVSRPAMMRVGKLTQSAASDETSIALITAEVAKLQKRAAIATAIAVVLLVLSAAGMAVARYL